LSSSRGKGHGSRSPDKDDVIIGKVISVNVPRRELRIAPDTSHPERFHLLRQLRLKTRENQTLVFPVASVRVIENRVIVQVNNLSADEIAAARGALVYVLRAERFPLPKNEYYIDDLVGLVVKDTGGQIVGRVTDVWRTPANDIYRVLDDRGRETLLPAIEDVIVEVDIERGELIADVSVLE